MFLPLWSKIDNILTSPSSTSVKIAKVLATSFGFGYAPVAPGTFGALFGSLVYILVSLYTDWPIDAFLLVGIVLCTALGTWACQVLSDEWGHDPSRVVLDEVVGVWIAYLFIPFSWTGVVLGFVLFRFF